MLRLMCVIVICLATFPALGEPASKYQVATITEVKTHQTAADRGSDVVRYDVSVKVVTPFISSCTPPIGMRTVKYAAERELLVLVGKTTIANNDILGNLQEVPIIGQKPTTDAKQSK